MVVNEWTCVNWNISIYKYITKINGLRCEDLVVSAVLDHFCLIWFSSFLAISQSLYISISRTLSLYLSSISALATHNSLTPILLASVCSDYVMHRNYMHYASRAVCRLKANLNRRIAITTTTTTTSTTATKTPTKAIITIIITIKCVI